MNYYNVHVTATDGGNQNRLFVIPIMSKFDLKSSFIISKNMMVDETLDRQIRDDLSRFMSNVAEFCVTDVEEISADEYIYCSRCVEVSEQHYEKYSEVMVSTYMETLRDIDVSHYVSHESLLH